MEEGVQEAETAGPVVYWFKPDRCITNLKRIGIPFLFAILVLGVGVGNFFATVAISAKPDEDGKVSIGAICYIVFVVAGLMGFGLTYIAQRQVLYEHWTCIILLFTVFVTVECGVGCNFSYWTGKNDVARAVMTPSNILGLLRQKQTLVVDPSSLDRSEFGEFVELSGGGVRVFRFFNITSVVIAEPVVQSQDGQFWLALISQDLIMPVNSAIADLRHRFPNTTLQTQVVAVTGTSVGRDYFDATQRLDQTQLSFFVGLALFGFVMGIVLPIETLWKRDQ